MKRAKKRTKYIFVVGGVMSGVGKGVSASSLGKILQMDGYRVSAVKIDPYINVDAGTLNPVEHGETFVLEDGHETDQDMGNYERFLNTSLTRDSYMTTGSVYQTVIAKERSLGYGGKTVSVVPHIPLAVIEQIERAARVQDAEIVVVEIGGTVGEYENILFLEAARMMKRLHPEDVAVVLVSYLPTPGHIGEMKTKPTQQAIRQLQESGLFPDIIIARAQFPLDTPRKEKIAHASLLTLEDIISAPDLESIYDIPKHFKEEGLDQRILKKLSLKKRRTKQAQNEERAWEAFRRKLKNRKGELRIAIVGKYFSSGDFALKDAYVSVIEALRYASAELGKNLELVWVNARKLERDKREFNLLEEVDGILVPGGFGNEGMDGKDRAIRYAREKKIPFLGLCLGMQRAAIEFAQHVAGLPRAESDERKIPGSIPLITTMETQKEKIAKQQLGGTMRLGAYRARIIPGTLAHGIYGREEISERHRHRYELNPEYVPQLEAHGMKVSAWSEEGELPEMIELDQKLHPFFIATQFHPELQARPLVPHPLFTAFLKASLEHQRKNRT